MFVLTWICGQILTKERASTKNIFGQPPKWVGTRWPGSIEDVRLYILAQEKKEKKKEEIVVASTTSKDLGCPSLITTEETQKVYKEGPSRNTPSSAGNQLT